MRCVPFLRGMCDDCMGAVGARDDIGADYCDDSIYIAFFLYFSAFFIFYGII